MANSKKPPARSIATLIDDLDRIREELLKIQRSLEKIEPIKPIAKLTPESD
jgi:hypothetical protein